MEVWLFALAIILAVAVTIFFSYLFVSHYISKVERTKLVITVCTLSITVALLSLMLVPIDVFSVSSSLTGTGEQTNPGDVSKSGEAMKVFYYIFYITALALAFIIMPFAYFFHEEDDGEDTSGRAFRSIKFTLVFLIVFGVIITLAFVLKKDKLDQESDWQDRIINDFSDLDAFVSFSVGCVGFIGLATYCIYAGYGLAMVPLGLLRNRESTVEDDRQVLLEEQQQLEAQRKRQEEQAKYNTASKPVEHDSRYSAATNARIAERRAMRAKTSYSSSDPQDEATRKEERALERKLQENQEKLSALDSASDRCINCWQAIKPLRIVLGVLFLGITFLIIAQLIVSLVDRFKHSECKLDCGYVLEKPQYINPIDKMLLGISVAFPVDLFFYGGIVIYLYICCVAGMVALGVRLLIFRFYSFKAHATAPNGLIMGTWLLMFVAVVMNQQLLSLAPQYTTFGQQFYYGQVVIPDNSTQVMSNPIMTEGYAPLASSVSPPIATLATSLDLLPSIHSEPLQPVFLPSSSSSLSSDMLGNRTEWRRFDCDMDHSNTNQTCVLTQISRFIHKTNAQIPVFGAAQFFGNLILILIFFIAFIYGVFRSSRSFNGAHTQSEDPDAPNYVRSAH